MGGSEEILGEITTELREIAENYDLTEEERRAKLQQLEDNQIRLIQEKERLLEDQQLELFGIRLPDDRMEREVEGCIQLLVVAGITPATSSRSISKGNWELTENTSLVKDPLKTLRLSMEPQEDTLLQDFQQLLKGEESASIESGRIG